MNLSATESAVKALHEPRGPILASTRAAAAAAVLLFMAPGCSSTSQPPLLNSLRTAAIPPSDQQRETINDLLALRLPHRLTTIEYRVGSPILRVIDRHIENGELFAELYVVEGWDPQLTDRRRLYTTRDPLHIEAFTQLRCQARMLEYVSEEAYITTNPGMNWVVADSSLGYGLPAKQEFLAVLGIASDLLEQGYGMEEEPFPELELLLFNRRMSIFDWHQTHYHYLATELFDAWVRSNQAAPAQGSSHTEGTANSMGPGH